MRGIMRQTETDIFYTHEFVNEFSINSICVGTLKMPTFETGGFIRSNFKIPNKEIIENLYWIFQQTRNAHEDIFIYIHHD